MAEPWFFDVLPCRPTPYPGECLSGYLVRLAQANGDVPVWDLVSDLFPRWAGPEQLALLRWEYPVDDWGRLPLRTQLSCADLMKLTVAPWVAKFRSPPVVRRPGNISPGVALRGVVYPALQICPRCMQDKPYVRLLWRLSLVQVCIEHGCLLQMNCRGCGQPLTVIGLSQRLLSCARCGTDLRTLPVVAAPEAVLTTQQRRQADLRFLLDPAASLVTSPHPEDGTPPPYLPQAIGVKFRYLRVQAGLSLAAMAQRMAVSAETIARLERGVNLASLPQYLAYLDVLSVSWPDFAALEVPAEFVHRLKEPPHLMLRLCPTPGCPNHQTPHGREVTLQADLPERRIARFLCKACRRSFTRRYDGTLVTKPRRPPLCPEHPLSVHKSAAEIERLTEMGLRGLPNCHIAHQLGWTEKTVHVYWIALNLEKRVHEAQAQRRAQVAYQREAALRAQVDAIIDSLCAAVTEITLPRVSRVLGYTRRYLHIYPELAAYVEEIAERHNSQMRRRQYDELVASVMGAIEEVKRSPESITVREVIRHAGLTGKRLKSLCPEGHTRVRQVVAAERTAERLALRQRQCLQINAAAAHLIQQGVPLTYTGLLKAAGVDRYYGFRDPIIHDLLEQWIGDSTPAN